MQARLIVASSRDLEHEAAEGRFRTDLFYRLNVVGFYLVPLRERSPQLIEAVARHFISQFASRNGGRVKDLTPAALRALFEYPWPGNVRELRNAVERAVALCTGEWIAIDDLPQAVYAASSAVAPAPANGSTNPTVYVPVPNSLVQTKTEAETACIRSALHRNNNNRLRAAAELGISRMTLYKKLHRYGLFAGGEA
jgi:two-component system response regulator HydG